jgi:hypothetical protein
MAFVNNIFEYLVANLSTSSALIGLLFTIAGVLSSLFATRGLSRADREDMVLVKARLTHLGSEPAEERGILSSLKVARERVLVRLQEAARLRSEQLRAARWSKIAANFLTIAQYVIGGVLASSFVQETLTPKWVGALGVLVLVASLFKQQFHPELNAENARQKALRLQYLIRSSEDQLAILDAKTVSGQDHSDAMITLMTQMTQILTEIENPGTIESTGLPPAK